MNIEAKFSSGCADNLINAIMVICSHNQAPSNLPRFTELNTKLFPPDSVNATNDVDAAELSEYMVILLDWAGQLFQLQELRASNMVIAVMRFIREDLSKLIVKKALEIERSNPNAKQQAEMN